MMRGNVDQLMAFRVALQYGPGNPIVIDDDNTVFEDAGEEDELEVRVAAGELVPIEDLPEYAE